MNNEESQGGKDRASWSKEILYEFFDICNAHIQRSKGRKGATTSQRLPWKAVEVEFQKKTKIPYDKKKLKSKLDWMKTKWSLWKQLKGKETGLGWDHEKGTISASDEWWSQKIQENPKFGAFRDEGVEQELEYRMDQLFGVSVASGTNKRNPFELGSSVNEEDVATYIPSPPHQGSNVDLQSYDHYEDLGDTGSGEWEDLWRESNSSPNTSHAPILGSDILNPTNEIERSKGKRIMESDLSQTNKSAKANYNSTKKRGTSALILDSIDFLRQSITEINEKRTSEASDGIGDALTKVFSLPGLIPGTDMFSFACSLMSDSANRTIFSRMPDDDASMAWIFLFKERKSQ